MLTGFSSLLFSFFFSSSSLLTSLSDSQSFIFCFLLSVPCSLSILRAQHEHDLWEVAKFINSTVLAEYRYLLSAESLIHCLPVFHALQSTESLYLAYFDWHLDEQVPASKTISNCSSQRSLTPTEFKSHLKPLLTLLHLLLHHFCHLPLYEETQTSPRFQPGRACCLHKIHEDVIR